MVVNFSLIDRSWDLGILAHTQMSFFELTTPEDKFFRASGARGNHTAHPRSHRAYFAVRCRLFICERNNQLVCPGPHPYNSPSYWGGSV
ncbi:hypothetical protein LshimejAT787_2600130 [Lyophyllum shimeji]|uniref:Uncharacterized protein n=1 Tax=Lyophyllum shimeji TaxID=47721 RepID=A0A9P3Q124_LYOSH|nr:hypothetical protein LshimejAT787_2600130 [Lyophyllum shimeji]